MPELISFKSYFDVFGVILVYVEIIFKHHHIFTRSRYLDPDYFDIDFLYGLSMFIACRRNLYK